MNLLKRMVLILNVSLINLSMSCASEFYTEVDIIPTYVSAVAAKWEGLNLRFRRFQKLNDDSKNKEIPIWECTFCYIPLHPSQVVGYKTSVIKFDYVIRSDYQQEEREDFKKKFPDEELHSECTVFPRAQQERYVNRPHFVRWEKNYIEHLSDVIAAINTFKKEDGYFPYYKLTGASYFWESYNCCTFNVALLHRMGIDFSQVPYFKANIDYKNASYWERTQTATLRKVIGHIRNHQEILGCEFDQKNYKQYLGRTTPSPKPEVKGKK